jgi:rhodanese-related sulfurtransferase
MLNLLKNLFAGKPATDYKQLVADGAQIIDVRSAEEFKSGHIAGAKNIPLQTLSKNLNKIHKGKPVITCCASGMRSANANNLLKSNGYESYNGGGWYSLNQKIK